MVNSGWKLGDNQLNVGRRELRSPVEIELCLPKGQSKPNSWHLDCDQTGNLCRKNEAVLDGGCNDTLYPCPS